MTDIIPPPAAIGDAIEDIDTPALLVDLDAFEANLKTMADRVAAAGLRFRPHAKTHKCATVARRQIALGVHAILPKHATDGSVKGLNHKLHFSALSASAGAACIGEILAAPLERPVSYLGCNEDRVIPDDRCG